MIDFSGLQSGPCVLTGINAGGTAVGVFHDASGGEYAVDYYAGSFNTIESPVDEFIQINNKSVTIARESANTYGVWSVSESKLLYSLVDGKTNCAIAGPLALNERGTVLAYDTCLGSKTTRYETISKNDAFSYLTLPPGYVLATGFSKTAFNDAGDVALSPSKGGHPYLWSTVTQGTPTDLGALEEDPNGAYIVADMNATTMIGATNHGYAWIWTAKTGMQDLAALLPPNSYGQIKPEAIDAQGDIGALSSANDTVWLYLKRK
jgi:hypothetical protein